MVNYVKSLEEFNDILEQSKTKLVVIDFTATWCPPCRFIGPIFEKMAGDYPDAIFVKVDVDEAADVAEQCGISAMPTFQFYKDGAKVKEFSGASESKLKASIQDLL
mmetsp:Transcript_21475/g.30078  ORF Transcript_21475/g.30078 Transcript_21475/m.30078 type:complete len:106 (+) Transcript_21475:105-422(+)|eukprot:CAMPEP_0184858528 /NCGR_PEP_ID=MMETSP0580-20130426/3613_1 /TAXON_ID=1118495 /ORGANISM="Dactyliosolen fragilissimus" /LENGTH=105 /DNA_ID=CAMNT_0027354709 /DNA_START=88 /DNA_END=405 /DNA_ORIENTATION=-